MTVPLIVVVGLLLGGAGSNGPSSAPSGPAVLPAVSAGAPQDTRAATVSTCARLISALPLRLAGLDLRRTESRPPSSSIVAWGDPPVVLRCGVARPAALHPGSSAQTITVDGVTLLAEPTSATTRYTVIDRSLYVDVDVPVRYHERPLAAIATAVAAVLPKPVCTVDPNVVDL
ncbi:MAG: DUF3515 domain-containing protein [Jatrophihabitantaceae bacterium]